jgi:hypothetical protein
VHVVMGRLRGDESDVALVEVERGRVWEIHWCRHRGMMVVSGEMICVVLGKIWDDRA